MAKRRKVVSREPKFSLRINNQIRVPRIRLVGDNLNAISEVADKEITPDIYYTNKAVQWAEALDLDLVEISPNADPPVCKIIDYKKFLYDKKKKEKELKAKDRKSVV